MELDYSSWHSQRESMMANQKRKEARRNKIKDLQSKSKLLLLLLDRHEEIDDIVEMIEEDKPCDYAIITGKTKVSDDEQAIERLRVSGGIIVGSLDKMYRGVDIPEIDHVCIASPVKFKNKVIQSIGRSLRPHTSKSDAHVSILNDSILRSQAHEQRRSCYNEYKVKVNQKNFT